MSSNSENSNNPKQFSYGGQAVIEGVMMRGANRAAIAARDPNGKIHIKEIPLNPTLYKGRISRTPFVRGLIGLWDALGLGTRALLWSADVALIEGTYYRVDYESQVGWVRHVPAHMHAEGNLDDVPKLGDNDNDAIPENSPVRLEIKTGKSVKILASPEEDAEVLMEIGKSKGKDKDNG
ncbi:MAG TPA: hypothetical protein VJZ27_06775, partial [Aggregatilineales bacterium]|nr:hypothetical protein [Aggregatilineales bacterium]